MDRQLMLGNEAVARGAWEAGCRVVSAYPGTPSTEITEYAAEYEGLYAEWAVNEKVALEVCAGASTVGARTLCCMKHVGVNVAADPLFTLSYTGINGGLVLACADDPGMHSSQNEQDSRHYARAAHVPMLEPSNSQECKDFTVLAFELSERFDAPVMLRLTTRISHSRSTVTLNAREAVDIVPYEKDPAKYVMMPAMARARHVAVEARMREATRYADECPANRVIRRGVSVRARGAARRVGAQTRDGAPAAPADDRAIRRVGRAAGGRRGAGRRDRGANRLMGRRGRGQEPDRLSGRAVGQPAARGVWAAGR
jgi:indolepyruvate ferredoxin oxidoreductase alpha subunit